MDFEDFLEGIERLIVRILLWVVIIPKTLFQIFSEPSWVVTYIEEELVEEERNGRFDDYISPVLLFLICSLVLFVIMNGGDTSGSGNNDINKMLESLQGVTGFLSGLAFLSLPLLFALAIEFFRDRRINRPELVRTLNIQCYYFSPLTLSIFSLFIISRLLPNELFLMGVSAIIAMGTLIWFVVVQVRFIRQDVGGRVLKSVAIFTGCTAFIVVIGLLLYLILLDSSVVDSYWAGYAESVSELELESDGRYTIHISGFDETESGSYRLIIEDQTVSEQLQPITNDMRSAYTLAYNRLVQSDISLGGKEWWSFEGQAGDIISIAVLPLDNIFDPVFTLLDENEVPLLEWDVDGSGEGGSESLSAFALPTDGLYWIGVYGFADAYEGGYELQLKTSNNSQIEDVSLGGQTRGAIHYNAFVESSLDDGESVQWDFNGQAGEIVNIIVDPDENFDVMFDVLDKNGVSILGSGADAIPIGLGYIYIFLVGLAMLLGLRSLWQNRGGKETAVSNMDAESNTSKLALTNRTQE